MKLWCGGRLLEEVGSSRWSGGVNCGGAGALPYYLILSNLIDHPSATKFVAADRKEPIIPNSWTQRSTPLSAAPL